MDILACPICKHFPLKLIVFDEEKREEIKPPKKTCEEYCGYESRFLSEIIEKKCEECYSIEILEGILICTKCNRWYPIIEEIPHMLPDELREKKDDIKFLKKYKEKIPRDILEKGKPVNLSGS